MVMPFEFPRIAGTSFEAGDKLPLFVVLAEWTEMVKSGRWKVDEKGVVGSVELLREMGDEASESRGRSRFRDPVNLA